MQQKSVSVSGEANGSRSGNGGVRCEESMRKTVHLCLSSHDEVMYRSEEDLVFGFNCLALAVLETESRLLAEGFMTTHNHKLVQTDCSDELVRKERYAYTRYFNSKYKRKGRLGEKKPFLLDVEGVFHTQTAANYVIKQGLHHGLASTPFEYAHCSANAFFRNELGKSFTPELLPECSRYNYLPHCCKLPVQYRMASNGLILREDIIDTAYVEEIYITPRNYLYQMNRLTDERMVSEQVKENGLPPVTLERIEKGVQGFDVRSALIFEQGRVDRKVLSDIELCRIIDESYLPRFLENGTIYDLPAEKRQSLGNTLWTDCKHAFDRYRTSPLSGRKTDAGQIRRCLAI